MIYQIVPEFYQYDAISQHARHIARMVSEAGVPATLCAARVVPESLASEIRHVDDIFPNITAQDILLLHFSIFTPLIDTIKNLPCRKVMIYHNITPPHFFEGISRKTAKACRKGLQQLKEAATIFHLALGVSKFNEQDLKRVGYPTTRILPLIVETNVLNDQNIRSLYYQSEKITLLHVGKWAPNKKIEDLIKVFYCYHKINHESRLILVGRTWEWENYTVSILDLIQKLHLHQDVKIFQGLSPSNLAALYRASDLYLSMSEHEGFCVPLIEAMACGCPVIAFKAGAVPETIQTAGLLLNHKNFLEIAELIHYVIEHESLQSQLCTAGKRRAKNFSYATISQQFDTLLPFILDHQVRS